MSRSAGLDDKPCRACTSFSEFIKLNNKELKTEDMNSKRIEDSNIHQVECPLDKDELGRGTWGLLHTIAAKYPDSPTDDQKQNMKQYLTLFSKFYPCESCAADLREELKSNPPLVENQEMLSNYLCKLHNQVNVKLGKPEYDCSKMNERWRDGWKDGSCG